MQQMVRYFGFLGLLVFMKFSFGKICKLIGFFLSLTQIFCNFAKIMLCYSLV